MSRSFPIRNPFPSQGTETLEGSWPQSEIEDLDTSAPTLLLDSVSMVRALAKNYLYRFQPSVHKRGQVLVLHGEHGSGKTHAVRYVVNWINSSYESAQSMKPLQMYAKAGSSDFFTVYKQLLNRLSYEELRDLALRSFGVLAREQVRRELGTEEADEAVAKLLGSDPTVSIVCIANIL